MTDAAGKPTLLWINQFSLLPRDGGGTRHFELGRELVRRGWNVTLLAADFHLHRRDYSRRAGPADRRVIAEHVDGVDIRWLWAAPYRRNDWRRAWNWLSFAHSVVRARSAVPAPDVVIGSSPQLFAARAGAQVAQHFGVPFLFEVRDLWPESLLATGSRPGLAYHLLGRVADALYRRSDRVLVLARGTADYLAANKGLPADTLLYVPNGVDVNTVRPSALRKRPDDRFTLIYAGAHGPANGLEQLLDAAELLGPDADVRFLLVGDGPAKESLRRERDRRNLHQVEFLDPMPKDQLVRLYAEADAGLMLLREAELFSFGVSPNKLFDYLAVGLPVLCNVPGEVARMVSDSGGGVQARDSSAPALVDAIRQLRGTSADERRAMGAAGREWVAREHSREVLGARLDAGLRALLPG